MAFMPTTAKLAYIDGSNVETVICIRSLMGVFFLDLFLLYKSQSFNVSRSLFKIGVIAVLSVAAMNYTFYSAIRYMEVGLATLIIFIVSVR